MIIMRWVCLTAALVLLFGCTLAEVQVNVASERTTLENQVLGSYNALSDDALLMASVRGVDPLGQIQTPPRKSPEQKDAVRAMQVLAFHADDVEAFKRLHWAGEDNEGLLKPFPMDRTEVPEDLKDFTSRYQEEEFNRVVKEVNDAREVIMRRVVEINENFTEKDLPEIRRAFGRLNIENALPGEKIQKEDGSWDVKP